MESAMQRRVHEATQSQRKAASIRERAQARSVKVLEDSMKQKLQDLDMTMQERNHRAMQVQLKATLTRTKAQEESLILLKTSIFQEMRNLENNTQKWITEAKQQVQKDLLIELKVLKDTFYAEHDAAALDTLAKHDLLVDKMKKLKEDERAWNTSYKARNILMEERIFSMRLVLFGSSPPGRQYSIDRRDFLDAKLEQLKYAHFESLLPSYHQVLRLS